MRITYIYTIFTIPFLMLIACSNHDKGHEANAHIKAESDDLHISLDDGQKWVMDDHTRSTFKTMSERINAGGDFDELGKSLKSDLDSLIQGCTMTGEAHNQLHVYLTHLSPAIEKLSSNGSEESLKNVSELLEIYPDYFR